MPIQKTVIDSKANPPTPEPNAALAKRTRKPWKKKTPVEIVLQQGERLRVSIAKLEEELKEKRKQLQKFEEVTKLLETS